MPSWVLSLLLGVVPILFPQFAWLVPVIKVAFELIKQLPFFKRPKALKDLHAAVQVAKKMKSTAPVEELTARMKQEMHG